MPPQPATASTRSTRSRTTRPATRAPSRRRATRRPFSTAPPRPPRRAWRRTRSRATLAVGYVADGTGSALDKVELWVKRPGDSSYSLASTDSSPGATGSFTYTAAAGDGEYAFYAIAVDKAGNARAVPASRDSATVLDRSLPTASASAPALTAASPVTVGYTAADTGSGLGRVELWVKRPGDSAYSLGLTDSSPGATGSFSYVAAAGDGDYAFYAIAVDKAGNARAVPASRDATTTVDRAAPTSSASSPATAGVTSSRSATAPTARARR